MDPYDEVEVHRIAVEKIRVEMHARFDERFHGDFRVTADRLPWNPSEIQYQFETYLLGLPEKRIVIDEHHEWPSTWWDAFKHRWFPKWALRRWPVNFEELHIDINETQYKAVCPHLSCPQSDHFEFFAAAQSPWEE